MGTNITPWLAEACLKHLHRVAVLSSSSSSTAANATTAATTSSEAFQSQPPPPPPPKLVQILGRGGAFWTTHHVRDEAWCIVTDGQHSVTAYLSYDIRSNLYEQSRALPKGAMAFATHARHCVGLLENYQWKVDLPQDPAVNEFVENAVKIRLMVQEWHPKLELQGMIGGAAASRSTIIQPLMEHIPVRRVLLQAAEKQKGQQQHMEESSSTIAMGDAQEVMDNPQLMEELLQMAAEKLDDDDNDDDDDESNPKATQETKSGEESEDDDDDEENNVMKLKDMLETQEEDASVPTNNQQLVSHVKQKGPAELEDNDDEEQEESESQESMLLTQPLVPTMTTKETSSSAEKRAAQTIDKSSPGVQGSQQVHTLTEQTTKNSTNTPSPLRTQPTAPGSPSVNRAPSAASTGTSNLHRDTTHLISEPQPQSSSSAHSSVTLVDACTQTNSSWSAPMSSPRPPPARSQDYHNPSSTRVFHPNSPLSSRKAKVGETAALKPPTVPSPARQPLTSRDVTTTTSNTTPTPFSRRKRTTSAVDYDLHFFHHSSGVGGRLADDDSVSTTTTFTTTPHSTAWGYDSTKRLKLWEQVKTQLDDTMNSQDDEKVLIWEVEPRLCHPLRKGDLARWLHRNLVRMPTSTTTIAEENY